MTKKLYFAYGSNLNQQDFSTWTLSRYGSSRDLKFHSIAVLPDFELAFTYKSRSRNGGVLDIKERRGQVVHGVLFEVDENDWRVLDRKEGVPGCYQRVDVLVLDDRGRSIPATTYRVNAANRQAFVRPHNDYLKIIRKGLRKFGLPENQLALSAENKTTECLGSFFVYGTSMRGEKRFDLLRRCGIECTLLAKTFGRLVDLGQFPGMVAIDDDTSMVRGEFIRVKEPEKAIELLDAVEGFRGFGAADSLYRRTRIGVDVGDARIRDAWTYVLDCGVESSNEIPSGDWRAHRAARSAFLQRLASVHANGDEQSLAEKVAQDIPLCFSENHNEAIRMLLPISHALADETLSERRLAQRSGLWTAIP